MAYLRQVFTAPLERDKDGSWWYVHVPNEIRRKFKNHENRGIVKVTVTLGSTTWDGSILPWADGSGQISVNKKVRTKESLELGDVLTITIQIRE